VAAAAVARVPVVQLAVVEEGQLDAVAVAVDVAVAVEVDVSSHFRSLVEIRNLGASWILTFSSLRWWRGIVE